MPFDYIAAGVNKVSKNNFNKSLCALSTIAAFLFILAFSIPALIENLINEGVDEQVVIDSTAAPNYQAWQTNAVGPGAEINIGYDLYFFDLQNPDGVLKSEIPELVEMGPYAFNEFYNKFDIVWSDGGDTVSYLTQRYYLPDPDRTGPGLSLSDNLTLPYPIAVAFEFYLNQIPLNISELVNAMIDYTLNSKFTSLDKKLKLALIAAKIAQNADLVREITAIENQLNGLEESVMTFVSQSVPSDLLLKGLMCKSPNGVSPFMVKSPTPAYFGWFNDPVLIEIQNLIDIIVAKNESAHLVIPWTTSVPGATINYTSEADTRRRRSPDVLKTGLSNTKEVALYQSYNNMEELWCCIAPMDSQNTSQYVEGSEFPTCAHFQSGWTDEEATKAGYQQPFGTNFANRVQGNDGNMMGRPVDTEYMEVFISDIYRSVFLIYTGDVDWFGVSLRRYGLNPVDVLNATAYPDNAQFYSFGPSGLLNVTNAVNIPCFISFPHFLNGDPSLISAVRGLAPAPDIHSSYLDIEPVTGLLARAKKRLQINYQLVSKTFPNLPPTFESQFERTCANLTILVEALNSGFYSRIPTSTIYQLANLTQALCGNSSSSREFIACMSEESDWKIKNDLIYFPYGWVQEYFTLSEEDADMLQESILAYQDLAQQFQFWSFIAFGIVMGMIVAMLASKYLIAEKAVNRNDSYMPEDSDADQLRQPLTDGEF